MADDYEDNGKGAFWSHDKDGDQYKSKKGKRMLKGSVTFGGVDYWAVLLPNPLDEKRKDSDPDVVLFIGAEKEARGGGRRKEKSSSSKSSGGALPF